MASTQRSALRLVDGTPRSLDLEWLVPSIATGDEPAIARLYDATGGLLFGLLLRMMGNTATAEEVLFEVYDEVRKHAARFDRNHESLLIWLITIAHRRALEHLCSSSDDRQFMVSVGLTVSRGSGRSSRIGINKSAHRRLVGATLGTLSPAEQKMIELAYFSRMTTRAIALKLRQSVDTVETGLQYGISQLYTLFKN